MNQFSIFAAAVCFLGLTPAVTHAAAPPSPAAASNDLRNADPDARLLLGRANLERVGANKPLLSLDPLLCKAALALARDRDAGHPLNTAGALSDFPDAPRQTVAYFRDTLAAGDKNKPLAYDRFDENVCYEPVSPLIGKTKATLDAAGAWKKWQDVPGEAAVCLDGDWTAMGAAVYRSPRGSVCIVVIYAAAAKTTPNAKQKATPQPRSR